MKKSLHGLTACLLFLVPILTGCGADEQPKEGSAEIVKTNPPPAETPPEFKGREAEKMKHGGYDPSHPDISRGHQ